MCTTPKIREKEEEKKIKSKVTKTKTKLHLNLLLFASAVFTVRLIVDTVELKRSEGLTASGAAEAFLVITLAKNSKEALIESPSTSIANSPKSKLVAFRHSGWAVHLAFMLDEFLKNKLVTEITTETLGMTNLAQSHNGVAYNRLAAACTNTLRIFGTVTIFTCKATVSKLTEGLKRLLAA